MNEEQIKTMWEEYKNLLLSTKRQNIENLIKFLDESDFKIAPASTKYHHAYQGGLLKHSLEVYYNMYDFNTQLQFFDIPQDSIIIMSLLHDICKVNCYIVDYRNTKNQQGEWIKVPYYQWSEIEPIGHSEKSIMYIYEHGVQLTHLERACIRNHMGFSEQEYTPRVSALFSKCPQSLVLHWADMQSTYVQGSQDLLPKFRQKVLGNNLTQSLSILEQSQYVQIGTTKYKLAPQDIPVDNEKIIIVKGNEGQDIKVYAPYGDGLPI